MGKNAFRVLALTIVALALVCVPAAKADTYSVASQSVVNIGNDGTVAGSDWDHLNLTGVSSGSFVEVPGTIFNLGQLDFTAGYNCNSANCNGTYTLPLSITINGVTELFNLPISAVISYSDTVTLASTAFDFVVAGGPDIPFVTNAISLTSGGSTVSAELTATVTPEPVSLILFGTGLAGIGGFVRRRLVG
jgi:hypothetical protein